MSPIRPNTKLFSIYQDLNIEFKIAVDGGSASGKTTGGKLIAKKFKMKFLSSGNLYRFCALKILENENKYTVRSNAQAEIDTFAVHRDAARDHLHDETLGMDIRSGDSDEKLHINIRCW